MKSVKYDQLQRFKLIELSAFWEGELSTKHLCKHFGIQRQQASRDIQTYLRDFGKGNLEYDASKRRYVATEKFVASFIDEDIQEYFRLIENRQVNKHDDKFLFLGEGAITNIDFELQDIAPTLFRALLKASATKRNLNVDYRTLEQPTQKLEVISPHTIFRFNGKWLVRAFSFSKKLFCNFNLELFFDIPTLLDDSTYINIETDDGWNTSANINVIPDPRLTAVQKRIIEKQFCMDYGSLLINCRVCLIPNLLNKLNIDVNVNHPDPLAQKIVVENLNAIKRWVF